MAIEVITPKVDKVRAIRILRPCLVAGQPFAKGAQIRVPEADAYDLVHAGQAEFLDGKK